MKVPGSSAKKLAVAVPLLSLVLLALIVLLRSDGAPENAVAPASERGARPNDAAVPPASSPDRPDPSGAHAERAVEETLNTVTSAQAATAVRALSSAEVNAIQKAIWLKEDATLAQLQTYGEVRQEYLAKAAQMLKTLNAPTTEDIVALASSLSEEFWSAGSLSEPAACEHAYLARAVVETALETDPENFRLLTALRHAISLTAPSFDAEYRPVAATPAALWPVLDKQRQMILSGRAPVSVDAMLAMYDWLETARALKKDAVELTAAWKWLVDNAQAGGWGPLRPTFEQGLQMSQRGVAFGTTLYCTDGTRGTQEERIRLAAQHVRLLPSHSGPKAFRDCYFGAWLSEARMVTRIAKRDPATGKVVDVTDK